MMLDNIPQDWIKEQWDKANGKYPLENTYDAVLFATMLEALMRDKRVSRGIMADYLGSAKAKLNDSIRGTNNEFNH